MLEMKDLPYTDKFQEIVLEDDLLLDDSAFSNKSNQIARKGETVKIKEYPNYGVVLHKVHGSFRY